MRCAISQAGADAIAPSGRSCRLVAFRRLSAILNEPEISRRGGPMAELVLVEDYVEGKEVALEGLLTHGRLRELALVEIEGLSAATQVADIEEITMTIRRGAKLVPLPEGSTYLGFIFARAETPQRVEAALRQAHRRLRFLIEN